MPINKHSEFNFACPKHVRYAFGLTEGQLIEMIAKGKVQLYRKRQSKRPKVVIESLAEAFYSDRENVVMKRWGYDYESVEDKFEKTMIPLHGFPRCFFKDEKAKSGFYRVFHKKKMLSVLVFVMEDFVRCVCYNRTNQKDLETIYSAFMENKIDWED